MIDTLVDVNPLMPFIVMLGGILFLIYAIREPRYDYTKQGIVRVDGRTEPIVYLYLTLAASCFTLFGWMLHS